MFKFRKIIEEPKKIEAPSEPIVYPNGTFISTENGFFYISNGYRYKISERALETWRPNQIAPATERSASKFKVVGRIGFRNGTLINNISDGKLYLIVDSKRRHITDPAWLDRLGYGLHDAILVSEEETNMHKEGEVLN